MTSTLVEKAKECKSAEELLALAKENGFEMTAEEAAEKYAMLHNEGELSDDELDAASGGGCETVKLGKAREPEIGEMYAYRNGITDRLFPPYVNCVACGRHRFILLNREGRISTGKCCNCGKEVQYSTVLYEELTIFE